MCSPNFFGKKQHFLVINRKLVKCFRRESIFSDKINNIKVSEPFLYPQHTTKFRCDDTFSTNTLYVIRDESWNPCQSYQILTILFPFSIVSSASSVFSTLGPGQTSNFMRDELNCYLSRSKRVKLYQSGQTSNIDKPTHSYYLSGSHG